MKNIGKIPNKAKKQKKNKARTPAKEEGEIILIRSSLLDSLVVGWGFVYSLGHFRKEEWKVCFVPYCDPSI